MTIVQLWLLASIICDIGSKLDRADDLRAAGRYREAEALYRAMLPERTSDEMGRARVLNQLGMVVLDQGKPGDAEVLLKEALGIRSRLLGPRHRDTLVSAINLGSAYLAAGRPEAATLLRDTLQHAEGVFNERELLQIRRNLAYLYLRGGDVARAVPLVRRNLSAVRTLFGPADVNLATELNNMAEVSRAGGRHSEAEQYLREALAVFEQGVGREHPLRAKCLANLAGLYAAQRKYAAGEPVFQEALGLLERAVGPQSLDVATVLLIGADLNRGLGRAEVAVALTARALDIAERVFGSTSASLLTYIQAYGAALRSAGRKAEARSQDRRVKSLAK